ncbi:MotA/TolQ/ExbB proton channel family protein [Candidatus Poribacteria bacterium]|nr:MotA/TolQ/ExbB proton channel family protein [Candidatus Poribacteria bacterium]
MGTETALQRYVLSGGAMMIFLIPTAFLLVAFAVQGFINLRRSRVSPRNFPARLGELLRQSTSREQLAALLEREGHSLASILRRVVRHLDVNTHADPVDVLRKEIEEECTTLQERNSQLAVIYNVAPLMGLLGTVFGILRTFSDYAASQDPSIALLSKGITVALLTTAWGLSIAIPALLFLYYFTRRIHLYEQDILPQDGLSALQVLLSGSEGQR